MAVRQKRSKNTLTQVERRQGTTGRAPSTLFAMSNVGFIFASLYAACMLFVVFNEYFGASRYLFYLLPIVMLIYASYLGKLETLRGSALIASAAVIILVQGISLLVSPLHGLPFDRDIIIVGLVALTAIMSLTIDRNAMKLLTLYLAAALILQGIVKGFGELDLSASQGLVESPLSFPLGILFIYFYSRREYKWTLLALLLVFVSFKRIAIAGCLGIVLFDLVVIRLLNLNEIIIRRQVACFMVVCFIIGISQATIIEYVVTNFLGSESMNGLTLGRFDYYTLMGEHLKDRSVINMLFGSGPGASDSYLGGAFGGGLVNPHNDWLKIYFDYGILGSAAFLVFFYYIYGINYTGLLVLMFLCVVMLTDNTLIYIFVHILAISALGPGSRRTSGRPPGLQGLRH